MPRQSARNQGHRLLRMVPFLLVVVGCNTSSEGAEAADRFETPGTSAQGVRPGVEVLLSDSLHLVSSRRVGLITNHTGIDSDGVATIDRLYDHPAVDLVALFAPEHGIRGAAEAGVEVSDETDGETGLPIHSLYGATLRPTPEMLEGVEVLAFDIQDIGARYYTYVSTMALGMEAAGEAGIPFVVLDRPNPLGGAVQGNVLDPALASFVGRYPVPMRHGMTPGELANLFRDEFGISVDLHVVPVDGWTQSMLFDDTGLPWRPPSPNIPNLESALHYPGTCLFEGTNLSVGRGTDRAFQWIGAPWLDGPSLAERIDALDLPGVVVEAVRFTPVNPGDGKFDGVEVSGIRLEVSDAGVYDPTVTAVAVLVEARRLAGDRWEWNETHFDRLAGTQSLRVGVEQGVPWEDLTSGWAEERDSFEQAAAGSRLYP